MNLVFRILKWAGVSLLSLIVILFLALFAYTHRGSRPWIEASFPSISNWNSLRITLSRGPCLGTCPVYAVSVDGAGNVMFDGEMPSVPPPAYGMVRRTYRSRISETSVHALFDAFRKAQFFWLYSGYAAAVTDAPTCKISIAFDGHKKEVLDYEGKAVGMPEDVTKLEVMIDRITGTGRLLTFESASPADGPPSDPPLITVKAPKFSSPKIIIEETGTAH